MSLTIAPDYSTGLKRLEARETVYRLSAAMLGYPLEETWQVLQDGSFRQVMSPAWQVLTGTPWPQLPHSPDLTALQVGYTATFLQGRRAPRVPLVGSDYEQLYMGLSRGSYLLNVQAFYRHFGLQAAQADEGHTEEPDHLVAMLEFCSLLCHLERAALEQGADADSYRRAQRDFIARYLGPLLDAVRNRCLGQCEQELDASLQYLLGALPDWVNDNLQELSAQVGPSPQPDAVTSRPVTATQPLWD